MAREGQTCLCQKAQQTLLTARRVEENGCFWYNMRHSVVQVWSSSWRVELLCPTSTSTLNFGLKNMGEKTLENLQMGYSAAYPTGAERCLFLVGVVSWSCSQRL